MLGIGMQELLVVAVLCLLVLGPDKVTGMARNAGHFVRRARESVDDFKSEMGFDGYFEESEDFEEDDEAEWFDREDPYEAAEEDHTGNQDLQSPVLDQGLDGELREVHLEK